MLELTLKTKVPMSGDMVSVKEQVCLLLRWRNWKILPSKWWRDDRRLTVDPVCPQLALN